MTEGVRINKALAILGICSRRNADELIKSGNVFINRTVVNHFDIKVFDGDIVSVAGKDYVFQSRKKTKVWKYYKPVGLVTTHKDERGRRTVFDDLKNKINERVISVGRLDLNSEGLLLLTNDSSFSKYAESSGWKRYYRVRVFGNLTDDIISKIQKGVTIDGIHYAPMQIIRNSKNFSSSRNNWITCILIEGKNREIRKIFDYFKLSVNRLIRYKYGSFELGNLKPGEVKLTELNE